MRVALPIEASLRDFDARIAALRADFAAAHPREPERVAWVRAALAHMVEVDQAARVFARTRDRLGLPARLYFVLRFHPRAVEIEQGHVAEISALLERHGWIGRSRFGDEADRHAWLLVHHADVDLAFQKRVLGVLEAQAAAGETQARRYARLYDRIAAREDRPQRYGTQGRCDGLRWEPLPIEAPERLDARRAAVGLDPIAVQRQRRSARCLDEER